ncbi:hypothetical protein PAPYR_9876 [Paratrimastix pyriformis]|uniref:Secreted protein n=1 Tax=Paratrimastix pyriformis TaxID=342808 RepID=A0ABQ8UEG1_9EUKA|nr:hypothetical protein PAPYR_9876 [Paratrimastix pyriformis]
MILIRNKIVFLFLSIFQFRMNIFPSLVYLFRCHWCSRKLLVLNNIIEYDWVLFCKLNQFIIIHCIYVKQVIISQI